MRIERKHHLIQLGYILSVLLFLSGAVYFFASNWADITKASKITLSVFLMLGMYAIAYIGKRILPQWFMVSGTIAFGVTLTLLDQIYNSHPESYTLFFIWLIPAVLYAFVTKLEVYKLLSYILFHLGFYFLVEQMLTMNEVEMYWLLGLLNLVLFIFAEKQWLASRVLKYLSFASIHFWMIVAIAIITLDHIETLIYYTQWIYLIFVLVFIYVYVKKYPQKALFAISVVGLVVYGIIFFLDTLFETFFKEYVFMFGLLFVIALVAFTVFALRKWKLQEHPFIAKVITGSVTAFATIVGTISVVGFFILTLNVDDPHVFYYFGALMILSTLWISLPTISYTMILMGSLVSSVPAFDMPLVYFWILWIVVTIVMVLKKSQGIRSLLYFYMNITIFVRFAYDYELWGAEADRVKWMIVILAVINAGIYALKKLPSVFRVNGFIYALLFCLWYTQQDFEHIYFYILVQLLFFTLNLLLLFWTRLQEYHLLFWSAFIVFIAFLSLAYYDFVWKLLHKSIALFVLGIVFLVVTLLIHRRYIPNMLNNNVGWYSKRAWLIGILVLQIIIVGWQIGQKEFLLQVGTEIKLELAPLDPRSMMQGDYVVLNYQHVSEINQNVLHRLGNGTIQIVLREHDGVYQYAGYYKHRGQWNLPYEALAGDVMLKGRVKGFWMDFGIEQYYVPEGTGRVIEEFAKYALVRVGKNGDAIVVGLTDN